MNHQLAHDLVAYWDRLRDDAAQPDRRALDLAQIRRWLPWIAMLDADEDRGFPIRSAGAGICSLFGRELLGTSFAALWRLTERAAVSEMLDCALAGTVPVSSPVYAEPRDRALLELELLVLPFAHRGHQGARALCALMPSTLPSWIGLIPVGPLSWQPVVSEAPAHLLTRASAAAHTPRFSTHSNLPLRSSLVPCTFSSLQGV
ncbi:MAG: hypothetical protein JWM36_2882 [Hyphomicrobiales bacterium]|nr:hypothetical protein [Hyphomicrobiales bacterium]